MFWRPQSVERKIKTDQQSLIEQCQQLAHDREEIVVLSKCKGLLNTDCCGYDIIISWH